MLDIDSTPKSNGPQKSNEEIELIEPLQKREKSRLKKCEHIIGRNLKEFFEVGKALATIKEERLYRENYKTFEQYCYDKWDFSRFRAYQLINASSVHDKMLTIVNIPLPKNEAQIRPLLKVPEEKITETWKEFIHENGGLAFSAKDISNFIRQKNETAHINKTKPRKNATAKNQSLGLTFELSNLIKGLIKLTHQYEENEDLVIIVNKIKDCSERIQDSCLYE